MICVFIIACLNRTKVELKYLMSFHTARKVQCLNRTKVELKYNENAASAIVTSSLNR